MADFKNNYNWPHTLSYDADVTIVCTERGPGKTYGIRYLAINDWIERGYRCVEVCRTKDEVKAVSDGYHRKLVDLGEFPEYVFKSDSRYMYIARKPKEGERPDWEVYGYFVALTLFQTVKKKTYSRVRKIIMDEAAIDTADRYHGYLPREFYLMRNVINSCSREREQDKELKDAIEPRLYLLMNAVDLLNPYFTAYRIDREPKAGYSWHGNKTCILHYMPDTAKGEANLTGTVAGRMTLASGEVDTSYSAKFVTPGADYIAKKPPRAKFSFGIVYKGEQLGVWLDSTEGYYYVNHQVPNNTQAPIYALTADDGRINYVIAKRSQKALKTFTELYYMGIVRYDTHATRGAFMRAMSMFGIT
jgi:hypothetical protein